MTEKQPKPDTEPAADTARVDFTAILRIKSELTTAEILADVRGDR
ncbi:MAG TPA: hypothetical protein VJQ60_13355 [Arthrobacter sp.]|nr:hypothetical protein [Arthrobacter sp.]